MGGIAYAVPESLVASVDWLTLTALSVSERRELGAAAKSFLEEARRNNEPVKPWKFKGYEGWATEGFRSGIRRDSDILQLSGPRAETLWLIYTDHTCHCTRLDLAVTMHLEKRDVDLVRNYYKPILGLKQAKSDGNWRTEYALIENTRGGQTLYVGSRLSDKFGRIYDKGAEQPDDGFPDGYVWRYEVVLQRAAARPALVSLRNIHKSGQSVADSIAGYTWEWFDKRKIPPRWPQVAHLLNVQVEAHVTSDAKRLAWLTQQVRPTVGDLANREKLPEVLKALGLDGIVEVRKWNPQSDLV